MGDMAARPHILVVGTGSVGKRHARNLRALGCTVSAMDPRADRLDEAAKEGPLAGRWTTLESALSAGGFQGVVIGSPPRFHVDQSIAALRAGLPVFLEKPVSPDLKSAERLALEARSSRAPLLLGYTYRWWPPLLDLKAALARADAGRVLHVRCVMSAHLADWHPWERYQDFFMASAELGGGALLDESHFVDLMLWFFGMPASVFGCAEKLSTLEIDTDDNVDAWFVCAGARVSLHLDLFGRPHEKFITVTGERGTLHWSFDPNRLRFGKDAGATWEDRTYTHERNEMFVAAAREFLEVIAGRASPSCTIDDGVRVMRVIEAIRESGARGQVVKP